MSLRAVLRILVGVFAASIGVVWDGRVDAARLAFGWWTEEPFEFERSYSADDPTGPSATSPRSPELTASNLVASRT
jgi:hypothetical protein